jgi:hypothetical protein
MRTQITIFADAQLMPEKEMRIEHLRRLLADVVRRREQKIILLEVANEAWQNGFPGDKGVGDLREFTKFLGERTEVPVATTSNHEDEFAKVYANSAADIATWHFSRDRADDGWKPVYDCWGFGNQPGFPPASSNEPIGPGASVATESSSIRLVMAAVFAYTAKLPMYVFHSEAGVFGKTRFEEMQAIKDFRYLSGILPEDLPNWRRNDGKQPDAPFTVFANNQPNRYWPELPDSEDGCVRNIGSRKKDRFVCVPIGIKTGGLLLESRENLYCEVVEPVSGKIIRSATLKRGEKLKLPGEFGGLVLRGRVLQMSEATK